MLHDCSESNQPCMNLQALNINEHYCTEIKTKPYLNHTKVRKPKSLTNLFGPISKINNKFNDHTHDSFCDEYKYAKINYELLNDKRPVVNIKIFGEHHKAILDTGASICVFGQNFTQLWQKSSHIESNGVINVKLPNGDIVEGTSVKLIPIFYDNTTRKLKVVYAPQVKCPIIMGINFFHAFNFDIVRNVRKSPNPFEISLSSIVTSNEERRIIIPQHLQKKLRKIINTFPFDDEKSLGCQHILTHKIDTGEHQPIVQHQYNYNVKVLEKVHKVIDNWLSQGVIEKSTSCWRNPIVVVKKPDGNIRVCLDARKLNSITKRDRLLTPNVFEALSSIPCDVKIFGRLDKNQAFLQTLLAPEDKEKTAFFVKGRGLFHFVRMPFGLSNSPATQTRLMLEIFGDLEPYVLVYFDDIIVMGKNFEHYFDLLEKVSKRLRDNNLTISREKMNLMLGQIKILGHIVSEKGIEVDKNRTDSIRKWPIPKSRKELQRFIGLCNWYRRHIKNFSTIAAPMTELLKGKKFIWNEKADISFENLKTVMLSPPVLRPPDWNRKMILLCDASNEGVGAALTQIDENNDEYVIEYYSAKLTDNERKFSPTEKECLAVIKAIKHFRPYIELMDLTIVTDHYSLKYLLSMTVTSGRLARWILFLQPYVNCIVHRAGKLMKVADALSRAPIMTSDSELLFMNNDDGFSNLIRNIISNPSRMTNYRFDGSKVYMKMPFHRNKNNEDWREIPHPSRRHAIIQQAHEDCVHGGIKTTLLKIRELFYWKYMRRDVKLWVSNCYKCACVKAPNLKLDGRMIKSRVPKTCIEVMSLDIKGPFPPGGIRRYRYIVVLIDLLSRYSWVKMFNEVTSAKIVKFLDEVFCVVGYPKTIIHDNGRQFISTVFAEYTISHNITSQTTPLYCARNNPVERLNRTLGESLTLYLLDFPNQHTKWYIFVDEIILKLNKRKNEATGFSPTLVLFGTENVNMERPVRLLNDEHKSIMKQAYHNSMRKFECNKRYYNRDKRTRYFNPGTIVMTSTHKLSNAFKKFNYKLAQKYEPAMIINGNFQNGFSVKLSSGRSVIVDVADIKHVPDELQNILRQAFFEN